MQYLFGSQVYCLLALQSRTLIRALATARCAHFYLFSMFMSSNTSCVNLSYFNSNFGSTQQNSTIFLGNRGRL